MSNNLNSERRRTLGVALGAREVGFALLEGTDLRLFQVVNLRGISTYSDRGTRFADALERHLGRGGLYEIVIVTRPGRGKPMHPVVASEWHILEAAIRRHRLSRRPMSTEAVKRAFVPPGERPSNRRMAQTLIERYGLEDAAAAAPFAPEAVAALPSDRERYWTKMFLALGGAVISAQEQKTHS